MVRQDGSSLLAHRQLCRRENRDKKDADSRAIALGLCAGNVLAEDKDKMCEGILLTRSAISAGSAFSR